MLYKQLKPASGCRRRQHCIFCHIVQLFCYYNAGNSPQLSNAAVQACVGVLMTHMIKAPARSLLPDLIKASFPEFSNMKQLAYI